MASAHFHRLTNSIQELKRIYLDGALATPLPSPEQQELARAFVVFLHSELEYFVEESLKDLALNVRTNSSKGLFSKASISLLAFGALQPQNGGAELGTKSKKTRKIATRVGDAVNLALKSIAENHGVRQDYLAAMLVPFGLDGDSIDSTWIADLDSFCSMRGAFAHASRITANPPNPTDIWNSCQRLVWTNPSLSSPGIIGSFEDLDDWFQRENTAFGSLVKVRTSKWSGTIRKLKRLLGIYS